MWVEKPHNHREVGDLNFHQVYDKIVTSFHRMFKPSDLRPQRRFMDGQKDTYSL